MTERKNINSKLISNIVGTILIKGIAMFLTLFTMPSYMRYFDNQEVLGVWFTLVSILNWILMFDLGIGNGLRNHLVPQINAGNMEEVKKLVSSAYILLGSISAVAGVLGLVAVRNINWNKLFNISETELSEYVLRVSIQIVFIGIILQLFLKIITSIFYAMQKTALPNLLTLVSSILILIFVNVYHSNSVENKLIMLSYMQVICTCVPLLIATIIVFTTKLKDACPSIHSFSLKYGLKVGGLGGQFFVIQLCLLVISSTNEFLISNLCGAAYVVEYQTYYKVFYMVVTMFSLLTQPMWSAFSQANAVGDFKWMRKIYSGFLVLALLGTLATVGISAMFQFIVDIWLGDNSIVVFYKYSLGFVILVGMQLFINASTCVANGTNALKCQIICTVIGAVIKIPFAIMITNWLGDWVGVIIANCLALFPLFISQPIVSRIILKRKIETQN